MTETEKQPGAAASRLGAKKEKYAEALQRIAALAAAETDPIANMANAAAVIKEAFGFWWVGFYRVKGEELVLGPFQGPLACTRIKKGRGVCGAAWERASTIVVPDVEQFPGHIACSALSRSEIVVPVLADGRVAAVLDIDSTELGAFDGEDAEALERAAAILAPSLRALIF